MAGPTTEGRMAGCLLGGALGDALGAPVEFLSLPGIRARYGPAGIRELDLEGREVARVTDDTQMTLFTAEGLIRAWVRGSTKGICHPPSVVHHAYRRWLLTQEGRREDQQRSRADGWLIGTPELWARRAPGSTCLAALAADVTLGAPATNDSKGCGGG